MFYWSESLWQVLRWNDRTYSDQLPWCHLKMVCYEWLPVIIQPSIWPQRRLLEWSTRCVQGPSHLCKPAIIRIIGLPTCAAHCALPYPVKSVSGACIHVHVCSAVVDVGGFWMCFLVVVYKYLNHIFIQSILWVSPLPPEQLLTPFLLHTHWHALSRPWQCPHPVPCFMAPRWHSSSSGDWIQSTCLVTANCLVIHTDWHLIIWGFRYSVWNW